MNISVNVLTRQATALLKSLGTEVTALDTKLRTAGGTSAAGGLSKATSSVTRLGSSLQWAGYQLTHAFTIPLALAGGAVIKYALNNETAMANVKKVYGDGRESAATLNNELNALQKNFVALSDEFGVSVTDVTNVAAAWAEAGVSGAALSKSVENTLKTMVIGDLNATQATTALIAIQAQYGASTKELTQIVDGLNTVENQTGANMGDLITAFSKSAAVAKTFGVSWQFLSADIAALVPAVGTASTAGNALKTLLTRIMVPTTAAAALFKQIGINTSSPDWLGQTAQERLVTLSKKFVDLNANQQAYIAKNAAGQFQIARFDQLMKDIAESTDASGKALAAGTKGIGYYGIALDALGANLKGGVNGQAALAKQAKVASQELNAVLSSDPHKLTTEWTILKNSAAAVLTPLIPIIISIVATFAKLMEGFSQLNPYIQKFTGLLLLALVALGPILSYTSSFIRVLHFFAAGFLAVLGPIAKAIASLLGWRSANEKATAEVAETNAANAAKVQELWAMAYATIAEYDAKWTADLEAAAAARQAIRDKEAEKAVAAAAVSSGSSEIGSVTAGTVNTGAATASAAATEAAIAATGKEMNIIWDEALGVFVAGTAEALDENYKLFVAGGKAMDIIWDEALGVFVVGTQDAMSEVDIAIATAMDEAVASMKTAMKAIDDSIITGMATAVASMETAMESGTIVFDAALGQWVVAAGEAMADVDTEIEIGMQIASAEALEGGEEIETAFIAGLSGAGLIAVVAAVLYAVYALFHKYINAAVEFVVSGIGQLPKVFAEVFTGVVKVVEAGARAVYNLFSYLNPFAHHSPSLVENVQKGMAAVNASFATLENVAAPINNAYADIKKFGQATADLANSARKVQEAADIKILQKSDPGAIATYKALENDLTILTNKYNALGDAIKKQQAVVDKDNDALTKQQTILTNLQKVNDQYQTDLDNANQKLSDLTNTGITGMQAMSDKIFANTQAQKALQLQMDKLSDSVGGIDNVNNAMSDLNGQLEMLQGQQKTLQQGGAGSDILGAFGSQIATINGQKSSIQNTINQYDALGNELTSLQNQGDELDLENSLDFDGLNRQIQEAASSMKEMPFDQLLAQTKAARAEVDKYTVAQQKSNDAVNKQQKVVDAAQAAYDAENAKLTKLTTAYDNVNTAIGDINSSLQTMESNAQAVTGALGKAAGAGSGLNIGKLPGAKIPKTSSTIGRVGGTADQSAAIDKLTQEALDNVQKSFGNLDLLGPFKKMFGNVAKWVGDWIYTYPGKWGSDLVNWIGTGIKDGYHYVSEALVWTGKQLIKGGSDLVGWIVEGLENGWDGVISFFENIPTWVIKFFKNAPKWLVTAGKDLLYGLGYGLGFALATITKFFLYTLPLDIAKALISIGKWLLGPGKDLLWGMLKGLVTAELDIIKFLAITLPLDIGKALVNIAEWLVTDGAEMLGGFLIGIFDKFVDVTKWFVTTLPGDIVSWFKKAPSWLYDAGKDVLDGLWTGIKAVFNVITTGMGKFITGFIDGVGKALGIKSLSQFGKDSITGLWDGIKDIWSDVVGWFESLPSKIKTAIGDSSKWLVGVGKDAITGFWNGLKEIGKGALDVGKDVENAINSALGLPRVIGGWHFGVHAFGHDFGITFPHLTIPTLANGGIFDKATLAQIGEAGKEVVIPLTNPARAMQLAYDSGLINLIMDQIGGSGAVQLDNTSKTVSMDMGSSDSKPSTNDSKPDDKPIVVNHHTYNFGDLSFPNVTNGNDAEDFIKNLTTLANS